MLKGNVSAWIEEGEKSGIDLARMNEDKHQMRRDVSALGLPAGKSYTFPTSEINSLEIDKLFELSHYFCRLHHVRKIERPHAKGLKTAEDFRRFCSQYNLSEYIRFDLEEQGDVTHSGRIISMPSNPFLPDVCIVELAKGEDPSDRLSHGKIVPVHAEFDDGIIKYTGDTLPETDERRLVFRAVKCIGGLRSLFPGYYEFDVWGGARIVFRNYQHSNSPYGRL